MRQVSLWMVLTLLLSPALRQFISMLKDSEGKPAARA